MESIWSKKHSRGMVNWCQRDGWEKGEPLVGQETVNSWTAEQCHGGLRTRQVALEANGLRTWSLLSREA